MKKNVVMAVIATLAVGQLSAVADAATGRGSRPRGVEDARRTEERRGAERAGRAGADSAVSPFAEVKSLNLTRTLTPDQVTALGRKSTEPDVDAALKDIVALAKSGNAGLEDLMVARVTAIANLPAGYNLKAKQEELDALPEGHPNYEILASELAYAKFALRSYTKDFKGENVSNLTFLLNETNLHYLSNGGQRSGSLGVSFKKGNDLMAKSTAQGGRATRLELKEANKYCK